MFQARMSAMLVTFFQSAWATMNQNVHIGGSNGKVYLPWKFPYAARRAISPKHAQKVRNVLTGMVNGRYKALLENGLSNRNHRRYQIALRASGR